MLENIIHNGSDTMTIHHDDCDKAVKKIIAHVGKKIVIGVPLGLGKPIGLLNAFYQLASKDQSISLTILTGLTLTRPLIQNDLEKRFLEPILERILGDYEDPLYEKFRKNQQLPDNIKVIEFFLSPGKYLKNKKVQQDYISTNYTNVVRDALNSSINVIAQQVSRSTLYSEQYSLSCNTDLFCEIAQYLKTCEAQGKQTAIVAEINLNLPFMLGDDAVIQSDIFTDIVDTKQYRSLFAIPKPQLSIQDHLIGLYSSVLIKDGSCLQIGIGKLDTAITSALIFRHKENALYQDLLKKLQAYDKFNEVITTMGSLTPFEQGLYASTEMLSDGYMHLYTENILKKRVYDHVKLQQLLNSGKITEIISPDFIDILLENNVINPKLTQDDVSFLQKFGIFKSDIVYKYGSLVLPSNEIILADLTLSESKSLIIDKCLGSSLKSGKIIHAGFFLGSTEFYRHLNKLSIEELQQIDMTSIARTNRLCWSHELSELQRQHARFVNATMMITVEGTIISDGLENWQEVSGVGGQFDFANMAQKLSNARFIINCHSTRCTQGKVNSNILWHYPNMTLPRNFRDIIITEYGIADCRSKTDSEVIKAILNITDSRFQKELLKTAKKFGKISSDYEIPEIFQDNNPQIFKPIIQELQLKGYCMPYPFGSELTEEEQVIKKALVYLKDCSKFSLVITLFKAFLFFQNDLINMKYLLRMKLDQSKTIKEFVYKKLLKYLISHPVN